MPAGISLLECLLYYSQVTTELKQNVAVPIVLGAGTALLGVGVGFALPALARLLVALIDRTPFPVHGVIDLASDLPLGWSVGIVGLLGVVAGLYVAHAAAREALHLEVTRDHLKYRQEDRSGWVEREDLSAVFREGRHLVMLDHDSRPRARLDADALSAGAVQEALRSHGYPWQDGDPHEGQYLDWIDGRPEFTDQEHVLLRRRHRERKNPAAREALDEELAAHGLVLRERAGTVQVRRAASVGRGSGVPGATTDPPEPEAGAPESGTGATELETDAPKPGTDGPEPEIGGRGADD